MQKITFGCETITPMFLAGADGTTPELRAPSIKGAMRFWWRAMNGHLKLADLKKVEGKIFGDTSRRSRVIVRTFDTQMNISSAYMLPHKTEEYKKSPAHCFAVGSTFRVQLSLGNTVTIPLESNTNYSFTATDLQKLFILTCCLGGFGKRSRRGFGSVKIVSQAGLESEEGKTFSMPKKLSDIKELLNGNFDSTPPADAIETNISVRKGYPYIKKIEFGDFGLSLNQEIETRITKESHLIKENSHFATFSNAIGSGNRLASPIYVSVLEASEGLRTIITTLNTVSRDSRFEQKHKILQEKYIERLKVTDSNHA